MDPFLQFQESLESKSEELAYYFDANRAIWCSYEAGRFLELYGGLVVMDTTFKTNDRGWKLTTMMVRCNVGRWIPSKHS
jgi:hypothetical protein